MIRRARLSPGPWNRKPPKKGTGKRVLYEVRKAQEEAAERKDAALTWGCEYKEFLRSWWRVNGCAACGKHSALGYHPHHTKHRSRKGRAEWQVPICPIPCHREDKRGIEEKALEDHGVDLLKVAGEIAAQGKLLGFLPVEICSRCGIWHSTRYMLDETNSRTGATVRVCGDCAPEGPI